MYFYLGLLFLILFSIINFLSGFYYSGFIKNLIKTIPIFIKDLIIMDRDVFRGYGFWCYCGLGGSGKTISMVRYLDEMHEKYPQLLILTNFDYSGANRKITSWRDLTEVTNIQIDKIEEKKYLKFKKNKTYKEKDLWIEVNTDNMELEYYVRRNHGVLYGFDEIHLTFESTKWEDAPSNLLDYISQQRKYHKQIVSTSQVFTRIDKKLREQTNFVIECHSYLLGRLVTNKYYLTPEYISNGEKFDKGNRKRKTKKRLSFIAYDEIRHKYNTEEIMKDLNVSKSNDKKLLDLLKNYRS